MQNKKLEIYRALLLPSGLSAVFYTFLAGLVIVLNQFSFIARYLQLPPNVDFLRMFLGGVDTFTNRAIGQGRTDVVVVGLFWAIIGLVVYIFLQGIARFIGELSDDMETRRYLWPGAGARSRAIHDATIRAGFRVFAFILLVIVLFGLLPAELKGPTGATSIVQYILWFFTMWLTMHLFVFSLRLVMLKPRLFD